MFSKNIYGSFKINSALGINPQKKAWMPAVFVQEQPPLYVSLATGALVLILRFPTEMGIGKKWKTFFESEKFLDILLKINYHVPLKRIQKGKRSSTFRIIFEGIVCFFGEYGTDLADITSLDSVCELQAPHLFSSLVVVYCDWSTCDKAKVKSTRRSIECFYSQKEHIYFIYISYVGNLHWIYIYIHTNICIRTLYPSDMVDNPAPCNRRQTYTKLICLKALQGHWQASEHGWFWGVGTPNWDNNGLSPLWGGGGFVKPVGWRGLWVSWKVESDVCFTIFPQ